VPELIRKVRKHAPNRACMPLFLRPLWRLAISVVVTG